MTVELNEDQIKETLQGISIPPRPQIVVDLQIEQVMPDPDRDTIARLISQDASLAGIVLKTVNSPIFGLPNRVISIAHAVSLMGVNSVINLVTAIAVRKTLSDEDVTRLNRFWDTATDIATACTLVAKQLEFPMPDEAYALGLFHNCGIPLMMSRFPDHGTVLEEAYGVDDRRVVDVENEHYKTNHAVLGYFTARSWKLPEHLCDAIRRHHNLAKIFNREQVEENPTHTLIAILKIASHICGAHRLIGNQETDHEWQAVYASLFDYTGLHEHDIQNLRDSCHDVGIGYL